MDAIEWAVIGGFLLLIVCASVYAIIRLAREPRAGLDQLSTRLARLFFYPRFLDPLLAKPMTAREKLGWVAVGALMVASFRKRGRANSSVMSGKCGAGML
jgi:hypothetical protein